MLEEAHMAQVAGTYSSYDAIGIREHLSEIISNIAPTDTPFFTMCSSGTADQTLVEWQTDTLDAAANNAQVEGDDVAFVAPAPTVRLTNRTQISYEPILVTRTLETVKKAGRRSEMRYQLARLGKVLKRDIEFGLCQNATSVAGNDTTARQTRGLEGWIAQNDDLGAGGASPNYITNVGPTDGTARAFTESQLKNVLRLIFIEGGDPGIIMAGPFNKQKISEITGNATRVDKSEDEALYAAIDVYHSDFGVLKVIPNRFQRERTVFVLDKEYWELAWLDKIRMEELAKTGDAEKRFLVCEYALISYQEKASGAIRDLTTS